MVSKKTMEMLLIGTFCMVILLSGCGKKQIDYNMSDSQVDTSDENIGTDVVLTGRLGIPVSCDIDIDVGASGLESITIKDDMIEIPQTDGMSVVYYTDIVVDNAYKKAIAETFFDQNEGIYEYSYDHRIKSEIQHDIDNMKIDREYFASLGDTANVEWCDSEIAALEVELQTSPDEYPLADDYSGDYFMGTMNGQKYGLVIRQAFENASVIKAFLSMTDELGYRPYEGATGGFCTEGPAMNVFTGINSCRITQDEAVSIAEDFLLQCGETDMVQVDVMALEWTYYNRSTAETIATEYDGYVITFCRFINHTPVYQGSIYNADNLRTDDAWFEIPTENFIVYVDDHGIIEAHWSLAFSSIGEEEKNVKLLSWDEMIKAANTNIADYYSKYPTHYEQIAFNDVRLSYYPVIDESKDHYYKYIPVWIFSQYEEYPDIDLSMTPNQIVIINAMDGTVLDLMEEIKGMGTYEEYEYLEGKEG